VRQDNWEIEATLEAMRRIPEVREELGYPSSEPALREILGALHVGTGANAIAYLTPDEDTVFKVVFDADQATLSKHATRTKPEGIVPVLAVYNVGAIARTGAPMPAWVVIEAAVVPLTTLADRAQEWKGEERRQAATVLKAARKAIEKLVYEMYEGKVVQPGPWRPDGNLTRSFLWDLRSARRWIGSYAIDPSDVEWDLSESNIGLYPAGMRLVILDLGQTPVQIEPHQPDRAIAW
jgi:hypothetical protein